MGTYNLNPLVIGFFLISIVDVAMRGWGMWRAARMEKRWWFITLLVVNSATILPIIFLWMTNEEYTKLHKDKKNTL